MSKGWLDKISQWISEAQLPEGAFRFALHDYSLVPIALSMVLSYRRDRVLVIAADSSRAEVLCSGLGSYLKLLGDERPIVPVEELVLGRHQLVPENEAGR